jgi:hypothetical protein
VNRNPKSSFELIQKPNTMRKQKLIETTHIIALAMALPFSALAQSTTDSSGAAANMPASQAVAAAPETLPTYGLLGDSYSGVNFGYLKNSGSPAEYRDYGFVSNTNLQKEDDWGIDGGFNYDYLTGDSQGFHDYRNEFEFGATGFLSDSWGRPFLGVGAGWAWQHAGGISHSSFAYSSEAGVEFQVLRRLVLSPYIEYQAEPRLHNNLAPAVNFPNRLWNFGVMATYRLTSRVSASAGIDVDQYNARDLGYRAGLAYHF